MPRWRAWISKGFVYFLASIIAPFLACLFILQEINELDFIEAYTVASPPPYQRELSLFIVGDVMLDRSVRRLLDQEGFDYPFRDISSIGGEYDVRIMNLEGVYTDNPSVSAVDIKVLRFTFNPLGAISLKSAGFDFVSQANNHTNDFGREGAIDSIKYLKKAEIIPFGDYFNESTAVFFKQKGEKVALIGFNEFSNKNFEKIESEIINANVLGYFTIVFPHWGVEYERFPNEFQKTQAHKWIDLGADVVIGSHPHVVQPIEEYAGKLIFYSLGNFIFDQPFSRETQEGIVVSVFLGNEDAEFLIMPFDILRAKPTKMEKEEATSLLAELAKDSEVSTDIKQKISNSQRIKISR